MPVNAHTGDGRALHLRRLLAPLQLIATLLILAFVPGNPAKLLMFALVWLVTFQRVSSRELLCYGAVCLVFSVMDVLAVRQGVFTFSDPDLAGLPIWEFFMWGFFVLHVIRMIHGPRPQSRIRAVLPLAILFATPFATLQEPSLLLAASGLALALALCFFHDRWDLLYVGYTLLIGTLVEYTGVWSGQWHYPAGGVALWYVTMWAGIGLFIRRLIVPLVQGEPLVPHAVR